MLNFKEKIFSIIKDTERIVNVTIKLLPFFSVLIPLVILFLFQDAAYPHYEYYSGSFSNTFEILWKGRGFYIFFVWLVILEFILGWEKLRRPPINTFMGFVTIIAFCLPTIYIIISNYCGLNATIVNWAIQNGIEDAWFMPLSIEHLALAGLFTLAILLQHGVNGLRNIVISPVFLATIGILFMIDNIWKYGKFTPLQILVPVTATLAANVLGLMGYGTSMIFIENEEYGSLPILSVMNSQGKNASFAIAWPCSGIESLLIYTLMILLFLKNSMIPLKHRIFYFVFGAVITFFINVFRIATIFVIASNTGTNSIQVHRFHDYYGWLFSLTWIVLYPLIVIVSRDLWIKMKS